MSPRVREILSWYNSENPGVLNNLARLFNQGELSGTGKLVILPVDQGFEHGPVRSFSNNPDAYDPDYHFGLAIEAGLSAYAAPLGFLQASSPRFAGEIPLILKMNNSESLWSDATAPIPAITASVDDALQLGCVGIGLTIYPGSADRKQMYEEVADISKQARDKGLVVVIWSYARGEAISKPGETAIDVIAYAAHIAAQLGAHIIKVKPPTEHIEQEAAKKMYIKNAIKISSLEDRVKHVLDSSFNQKRIVIFSGGEAKSVEDILAEIQSLASGGSFGSIMGRNAFQRPKSEALSLLKNIINIYKGK
ncbi:MAG: class I fructose-bisphosphate aldolase [Bdellovibrionaceae bacterium]|nr:class I fructose-bisphosphate aldolase [Pseudobdellovibrionaceae bacterium]